MPDTTSTAQASAPGMAEALMALFSGKGGQMPGQMPAQGNPGAAPAAAGAPDTAQASALQPSSADNGKEGLSGALQNLLKFFSAKPGSASNDARYQKALTEAGIPADQTGVGK